MAGYPEPCYATEIRCWFHNNIICKCWISLTFSQSFRYIRKLVDTKTTATCFASSAAKSTSFRRSVSSCTFWSLINLSFATISSLSSRLFVSKRKDASQQSVGACIVYTRPITDTISTRCDDVIIQPLHFFYPDYYFFTQSCHTIYTTQQNRLIWEPTLCQSDSLVSQHSPDYFVGSAFNYV